MPGKVKLSTPKTNLFLDVLLVTAFVIVLEPRLTGQTIHELLGLALGGALLLHILLHWRWVVAVTVRFLKQLVRQARLNYLLAIGLFLAFSVLVGSGILISEIFETAAVLGLGRETLTTWRQLHSLSADLTLLFVALHIALHWKWIVTTSKRYLFKLLVWRGRTGRSLRAADELPAREPL